MEESQFNRHFNLLRKANLALVVRDIMEKVPEPAGRAEALASLAGKYAQLRREESNAARAQTIQERWKREQEIAGSCKQATAGLMPGNARLLHRLYLDSCGQGQSRSPIRRQGTSLQSSLTLIALGPANPSRLHPTLFRNIC